MRKAPSTLAATTILAVFLCLGTNAIAQCTMCVSATDQSCSGTWDDCDSDVTGCSSTTFTAPCTGQYTLRAWVGGCNDCMTCSACVWVVKANSGTVMGFVESGCPAEDCDSQITNVSLENGASYRLIVCKRACDVGDDCNDCDSECRANGAASISVLSCP